MSSTFRLPPLLHAAPVSIAALDLDGRVLDANEPLLAASGYTLDELRGRPFTDFEIDEAYPSGLGSFAALVSGKIDQYRVERRYRTRSGEIRDIDLAVSLVRDASGAPELCLAALHDVTERRSTAAALAVSEARYRSLVEQSPLSVQILSPDGRTLQVNAAWERLWNLDIEKLGDYNILEDPQLETLGLLSHIRAAFAGEPAMIPAARYDPADTIPGAPQGQARWVRAVIYPLKNDDGSVREVVLIHEDMTEQMRADEQRREAMGLLQLVVQQSGDAVVVADAEGIVRIFNPAAERLYGVENAAVPPEEWTSHYRLMRLDGSPLPFEETALYRAVLGQEVRDFRFLVERPDGTRRQLTGSSAPLRQPDGRPAGAVLIARDETDRMLAEQERERLLSEARLAQRDLEIAARLKDEFLATLSHELRTPLNAVLGWTRILRTRYSIPDIQHPLEVIERNAAAQARLIDDLLDVSRIITGKIALHVTRVDLRQIARAALETVRPAADARGVQLRFEIGPDVPAIAADAQRLQQVLWNLLSNGVKFTERGGRVELSIAASERDVLITVADTGIGIAPGILPYVFERFLQGDSSPTRAHTGLGIGLAIVRHLVELHGGTVTAESAGEGSGATFRVWLPFTP